MHYEEIKLSANDSHNSVMEKIVRSKSSRIVLVWPETGHKLSRLVDLVIIQRSIKRYGVRLAIVTRNYKIIDHAQSLGIPVFSDIEIARKRPWRRIGRRKEKIGGRRTEAIIKKGSMFDSNGQDKIAVLREKQYHNRYKPYRQNKWFRVSVFSIGMISILAIVFLFIPQARITLTFTERLQSLEMEVLANPHVATTYISGSVPAYQQTVIVEHSQSIASSGKQLLPDKAATGTIEITNLTEENVSVPANTIVITPSDTFVRFIILEAVDVPAGSGMTREADVQAVLPGESGNVEPDQIQAFAGTLGLQLRVTNPQPTTGGSSRVSPSPSQADYLALRSTMIADIEKSALEELSLLSSDDIELIEDTMVLSQILDEKREPQEDQPGDELQLTVRALFQMWYVEKDDINRYAVSVLDANLADGFAAVPGTLLVSRISEPVFDGEKTTWNVYGVRRIKQNWQPGMEQIIFGLKHVDAVTVLSDLLDLETPPAINMKPFWWPRLPFLPFQYEVVVQ